MVFSPRGFVLPTPDILQSSHSVPVFFFLTYLLAALGLCCCTGSSLVAASEGYSGCGARESRCSDFSCCGAWAPGTQASVVVEPGLVALWAQYFVASRLWSTVSVVVVQGFACRFLPIQGLNLCLLQWHVDSLPPEPPGKPLPQS